jgi:WD40 repeat protein
MSFSPDGKILALGLFDGSIGIWDAVSGALQVTLRGHTERVRSLRFSNDGNTLASGADDRSIRLWNIASGTPRAKLMGHTDTVFSLSFSSDGNTLASGSFGTIRLWNVATGAPRAVLTVHSGGGPHGVYSLNFSPDGKTLASGGSDFNVRLWDFAEISSVFAENGFQALIRQAEDTYRLRLEDIDVKPFPPETELDRVIPEQARWTKYHPLHWLPAAERGDTDAMIQLGIIYHRDRGWTVAES